MPKWKKPRVRYALGETKETAAAAEAAEVAADVTPATDTAQLLKEATGQALPAALAMAKAEWESGTATKKERRRLKHEAFMERLRLDAVAQAPRDALKMDALGDTLGELTRAFDEADDRKAKAATSGKLTAAYKRRVMTSEMANFSAVMQHPMFLEDPLGTLEAHVAASVDTSAAARPKPHSVAKAKAAAAKKKADVGAIAAVEAQPGARAAPARVVVNESQSSCLVSTVHLAHCPTCQPTVFHRVLLLVGRPPPPHSLL
eukprot:c28974_g1_i1.p1 GENE.c28974_g1_i1~~c28974_g1_i1.p1  ORF type:complete len:260 (+),score=30.68 c28974_g1_i1:36-815(+)